MQPAYSLTVNIAYKKIHKSYRPDLQASQPDENYQ